MRVFVELVSFHELKGDWELFLGALVFFAAVVLVVN